MSRHVLSYVFAASRMFHLLAPLTRVCVRTGTVKPGAEGVETLPTYPSIETKIGAASVDAMMLLWCVFFSTLQQHSKDFLAHRAHRIGLACAF